MPTEGIEVEGDHTDRAQSAGIDVVVHDGPILECISRGYVTLAMQREAYQKIDRELALRKNSQFALLWDSREVAGFDAGLPMALTRFLVSRVRRFRRAALVARHPMVVAVGRAAQRLVPPFPYAVCADRNEAVRFLREQGEPSAGDHAA